MTTVLIMAAGKGTRMRSSVPKLLHPLCGRPLIAWSIAAAREAGADRVVVVVSPDSDLSPALPDGVETATQPVADGTGGAVRAAMDAVRGSDTVVVIPGDHPLMSGETVRTLIDCHKADGAAATVLTMELDEPGAYGRVVRAPDGQVERIAEAKTGASDAGEAELSIREVSTASFAFDASALAGAIERLSADNAQGEYYLGDVIPLMREQGLRTGAVVASDHRVNLGINTRADLAQVADVARRAILDAHMVAGVTVVDPGSTWIDADVRIEPDAVIEPFCFLRGDSEIGGSAIVGPMTTLLGCRLGPGAEVRHSYLVDCDVEADCMVGPFAYIRPGSVLREGVKVGTFVEVKNSDIGAGTKVPHLSYLGDADIGEGSNIGAGTITANYDGFRKHRTSVGARVRIGVDTSLVAPVHVGDDAYTGAGSVIVEDVPEGALGIARADQKNVSGFADQHASRAEQKESKA